MPRDGFVRDQKFPANSRPDVAPFGRGRRVAIIRLLPEPSFEGWAIVERTLPGPHSYQVRFAGDPVLRERFVHPDWQAEPDRALTLLRALWRAETASPFIFTDFFPGEQI